MEEMNAFEIEKYRAKLATNGKYSKLRITYSSRYSEIPNNNTKSLWNNLNKDFSKLKSNPMAKDRIKIVANLIANKGKNVLNIGFGTGNLEYEFFNKYDYDVNWCGIDISSTFVSKAKKRFPQCEFKEGKITKINYPRNTFDVVVVLEVLEHIPPSKTLLSYKEIFKVLKSNGTLILSVPLNENLEELINQGSNPNAHVRIYTPDLLKAELEISGFKTITDRYLFAFNSRYHIKSFLANTILRQKYKTNNLILVAQKK